MTQPITGIDHVFLLVADLDAAADRWRRLGFVVSPKGFHSEHMGTGNHTIMLAHDYIELLGILRPTPRNEGHRRALDAGEGLAAIACRTDDTGAAVRALRAAGIATSDALDFERPVDLPSGGVGRAAFTIATIGDEAVPKGHAFLCQHRTRETVWLPELMTHANGALGLAGVLAASDQPEADGAAFARLFAAGAPRAVDGGVEVPTGTAPLTLLSPAALGARYPELTPSGAAFAVLRVRCSDVAKAEAAIGANGVAVHPTADGVALAAGDATGTILEFVA